MIDVKDLENVLPNFRQGEISRFIEKFIVLGTVSANVFLVTDIDVTLSCCNATKTLARILLNRDESPLGLECMNLYQIAEDDRRRGWEEAKELL